MPHCLILFTKTNRRYFSFYIDAQGLIESEDELMLTTQTKYLNATITNLFDGISVGLYLCFDGQRKLDRFAWDSLNIVTFRPSVYCHGNTTAYRKGPF